MNIELLAMELVEALLREVMTAHKPRICRKTGEKPSRLNDQPFNQPSQTVFIFEMSPKLPSRTPLSTVYATLCVLKVKEIIWLGLADSLVSHKLRIFGYRDPSTQEGGLSYYYITRGE